MSIAQLSANSLHLRARNASKKYKFVYGQPLPEVCRASIVRRARVSFNRMI
jgi:hypothetical protein